MRYKIVENGIIKNIIECDEGFAKQIGAVLAKDSDTVPPVSISLSESRQQKLQALKAWHDAQIETMKAKYSQAEIDSFLDKRNEAMAWRVNNTAPTPYIDAMSGGNSTVRTVLLNAILAKVDATAQLEALVLSKRDAIEAATNQAELDAIVW